MAATAMAVAVLGSLIALGSVGPAGPPAAPSVADVARVADGVPAVANVGQTPAAPGDGFLTRSAEGGWPPLRVKGFGLAPVSLVLPTPDRAVTASFVAVRGTVRGRADAVQVELETSEHRVVDSTLVDTHNVHGGIRPDRTPTIDVRLALPAPRPVGDRLWVRITALDDRGAPISTMRRPVEIGPLGDSRRG